MKVVNAGGALVLSLCLLGQGTAFAESLPVEISWTELYGNQGVDAVSPGERIYMRQSYSPGCGNYDIASCETAEDGSISAYYRDACGQGDQGDWVQRGCSTASEFGYEVTCCHEEQERLISYTYNSRSGHMEAGADLVTLTHGLTVRDATYAHGQDHVFCATDAAGRVSAHNLDSQADVAVHGPFVSEGCSIAANAGWVLSCCIEDTPADELDERLAAKGFTYVPQAVELQESECTLGNYAVTDNGIGAAYVVCNQGDEIAATPMYLREDTHDVAALDVHLPGGTASISQYGSSADARTIELVTAVGPMSYVVSGPSASACSSWDNGVCMGVDLSLVGVSWGVEQGGYGIGIQTGIGEGIQFAMGYEDGVLSTTVPLGAVSVPVSVNVGEIADLTVETGMDFAGMSVELAGQIASVRGLFRPAVTLRFLSDTGGLVIDTLDDSVREAADHAQAFAEDIWRDAEDVMESIGGAIGDAVEDIWPF